MTGWGYEMRATPCRHARSRTVFWNRENMWEAKRRLMRVPAAVMADFMLQR